MAGRADKELAAECANFFEQIKAILKDALALRDRRDEGTITSHGLRSRKGKIEASMDQLLDEPDLHDESIPFALHLLTNRDALFPSGSLAESVDSDRIG